MLNKPNILLIQTDQQTAETLGMYGNPVVRTPNLEKIAENGVLFQFAYCNYPACVPSRASMLTGRYAHTIRSHANFVHLNPKERTITHVLKEAGYQTAIIGKNHAYMDGKKNSRFPALPGEDEYLSNELGKVFDFVREGGHGHLVDGYKEDPEVKGAHQWAIDNCWRAPLAYGTNPARYEKCGSHLLGETAVDYIQQQRDKDKPFFMWLSYPDPHTPYQAPEPYASMYDPKTVPMPPKEDFKNKPERQKVAHLMDALDRVDESLIRKIRAIHYGMINAIDDSIGKVMNALEQQGLLESTIILFTADHGDSMGAHGLMQKHNMFYDSFTHVPFIMSWPSHIKHKNSDVLVELVDVVPTLLDLAGVEIPKGVQGKSLAPYLLEQDFTPREFVVMESGEEGTPMKVSDITVRPEGPFDGTYFVWCAYREAWLGKGKSIRTHEWKLNIYANGDGELYDLKNDPDEMTNLYGIKEYENITLQLEKKLLRWCMETEDTLPENNTIGLSYSKYKAGN